MKQTQSLPSWVSFCSLLTPLSPFFWDWVHCLPHHSCSRSTRKYHWQRLLGCAAVPTRWCRYFWRTATLIACSLEPSSWFHAAEGANVISETGGRLVAVGSLWLLERRFETPRWTNHHSVKYKIVFHKNNILTRQSHRQGQHEGSETIANMLITARILTKLYESAQKPPNLQQALAVLRRRWVCKQRSGSGRSNCRRWRSISRGRWATMSMCTRASRCRNHRVDGMNMWRHWRPGSDYTSSFRRVGRVALLLACRIIELFLICITRNNFLRNFANKATRQKWEFSQLFTNFLPSLWLLKHTTLLQIVRSDTDTSPHRWRA